MVVYEMRTNFGEKGDWGGVTSKKTYIASNRYVHPENLRVLVNKFLDIPYYKLFRYLWHDANPETDWVNNIEIVDTEFNKEFSDINKFKDKYELKRADFYCMTLSGEIYKNFPNCECKFEKIEKDDFEALLNKSYEEIQKKEALEKAERDKKKLKEFIKGVDKKTVITLLTEIIQEDK